MNNDVMRITLPDGAWWDIRTMVTRGMAKEFRRASLRLLGTAEVELDLADPEATAKALGRHPQLLNLDALEDAWLLGGTVAYSYGEVTLEIIDELPDGHVETVLVEMRRLYSGPTEEEQGNLDGRRSRRRPTGPARFKRF